MGVGATVRKMVGSGDGAKVGATVGLSVLAGTLSAYIQSRVNFDNVI